MTVRILVGDCRDVLATLPADSVHCVVTSPPYWGLRDYGIGTDALGLEPTWQLYIERMVEVFRAVRRVLRKDGTCWMNMGDCYASSVNGRPAADIVNDDRTFRDKPFSTVGGVLKPKDLCGMPWRVAFALQADGWWLRQDIIWAKPNPMPESVTDRCTKSHEYMFLLSKSARYFYDAEAIKEGASDSTHARFANGGAPRRSPKDVDEGDGIKSNHSFRQATAEYVPTRNKRSVWEIATAPFPEAHFATFPPALVEPCILAGCPKGGTVLDPFAGAGTTGLVADRLQRSAILIELNPVYAVMAERRIYDDAPLFQDRLASHTTAPTIVA